MINFATPFSRLPSLLKNGRPMHVYVKHISIVDPA